MEKGNIIKDNLSTTCLISSASHPPSPIDSRNSMVSLPRSVDILLFVTLFIFVLLFQLQVVADWITSFKVREILYCYLYFRIILCYKPHLTKNLFVVILYIGYSVFVGIHTYLFYGQEMALRGFVRFVNVALLAPLVAIIPTRFRLIKILIGIWFSVVVLGSLMTLYQLLGADLSWLTKDYIALRGNKIRFMTLLGEPNVGGMASTIIYVFAVLAFRSLFLKLLLLISTLILSTISLSKAAIAGLILATVFILILEYKFLTRITVIKKVVTLSAIMLIVSASVLTFSPFLRQELTEYARISVLSFVAGDNEEAYTVSLFTDMVNRFLIFTLDGIELMRSESSFFIMNLLFGGSFGIAGSAAQKLRGDEAVLPHNTFSEIFLVGGVFMLSIFLIILLRTFKKLRDGRNINNYRQALFIGFLLTIAFMPFYPVIYQPILGAFFWTVVGIASNSTLAKEDLALS